MTVEHVVVVGAGQMGAGIAQVALVAGLKVTLMDAARPALDKGVQRIQAGLLKLKEKGKLDDAKLTQAVSRLSHVTSLSDVKGADFAIEAVTENEELKRRI